MNMPSLNSPEISSPKSGPMQFDKMGCTVLSVIILILMMMCDRKNSIDNRFTEAERKQIVAELISVWDAPQSPASNKPLTSENEIRSAIIKARKKTETSHKNFQKVLDKWKISESDVRALLDEAKKKGWTKKLRY